MPEIDKTNLRLMDEVEDLRDKLHQIKSWCEAYPLKIFTEPDWDRAAKLLKDAGMSIDTISASNMRHVLKGVLGIINRE